MDNNEVKNMADSLVNSSNETSAYFKIDEYSDGEYFIKANKDGLLLYASRLLYASIVENDTDIYGINTADEWMDNSMLSIDYAELISESRDEIVENITESKLKDMIISYGCYFGLILFVVCGIVGGISIINSLKALF